MRKIFVSTLLFLSAVSGFANSAKNDTVAMTIAGNPISIEEFLFTAKKNGETDLKNKKNLETFVEMFKNFKLKVTDAEKAGLSNTESFKKEIQKYTAQLVSDYMTDQEAEEKILKAEYDRLDSFLDFSHIIFFLPKQSLTKDTVAVYQRALEAYNRIQNGEDFEAVGKDLATKDSAHVGFENVPKFGPMMTVKAFEDQVYQMQEGMISKPVRTAFGFHLIKLHKINPNPGLRQVSHILISFKQDSITRTDEEAHRLAEDVYRQAKEGADFGELVQKYSGDKGTVPSKGKLPPLGLGQMVPEFEKVSFSLTTPGEISEPVKTMFGYHVIKLEKIIDKLPYENIKKIWYRKMSQGEWNFTLKKSMDDRLKKDYNFVLNQEAYDELQAICNDYFPSDAKFYEQAESLTKELVKVDTISIKQNEFAAYIQKYPFSVKTYAGDFMKEVFDICIHDLLNGMEKNNLLSKYPEFKLLVKEFRDGTLLFTISNQKIWNKPADQQTKLEEEWIKELNEKYPVTINWKAIKKTVKN